MNRPIFYFAPTACAIAPHIALEEVQVEFEARGIDLSRNEQNSPAFLKVNPGARVPAMIIEGRTITEVPALLTYIACLRPEAGLIPASGTLDHARCFEWLGFLCSTVHVAYAQFRRPQRFLQEGSPCWTELSEEGRVITIKAYQEVERRLDGGWASGESYSIADMYLFPFFSWAWRLDLDMPRVCPKWSDLVERMRERPAVRRAVAREDCFARRA